MESFPGVLNMHVRKEDGQAWGKDLERFFSPFGV